MIFPLLKIWLAPLLRTSLHPSRSKKVYRTPDSGFLTIDGGGGRAASRDRQSANHITANMTYDNGSEEHLVGTRGEFNMQHKSTDVVVTKEFI